MPRKKPEAAVRPRITFPPTAWARIEALAARMEIDPPMLVRLMTSIQLVQWEAMANPRSLFKDPEQVEQQWTASAMEMFPETRGQPEPEPELESGSLDRPGVGFRPRSELDDLGSYSLLEQMIAGR